MKPPEVKMAKTVNKAMILSIPHRYDADSCEKCLSQDAFRIVNTRDLKNTKGKTPNQAPDKHIATERGKAARRRIEKLDD
ncbi:MAG: hypothetical protein AAF311_12155 [Pseudomonadota bacterium]